MTRALVVIDVQNEYVTGGFPIEFPPVESSLERIGQAIDAANAHGVPVIVVQQIAPPTAPRFAEGSEGGAVHPVVAERERHALVPKRLPSSFAGTELDEVLRGLDVDTITIVGYMTQMCVDSTARDALHRGFAVEVLSDATGALSMSNEAGTADARSIHETTLVVLHSRFAAVATTDEWVSSVEAGSTLTGSNLLASITGGASLRT